jgi:hypothetical protein
MAGGDYPTSWAHAACYHCGVDSPYREPPSVAPALAPTRDGPVRVEVGSRGLVVELGSRLRLAVSGGRAVFSRSQNARRRRVLPLGRARLWVARAHPTRELALWYEVEPGRVQRLGAVRPLPLFEQGALAAWRSLDRAAAELSRGLQPWSGEAEEATELGKGGHRVLLVRFADRLVVYARPLFRERPRRALEVCGDGTIVLPGKNEDRRTRFHTRSGVSVSGDRIVFADRDEARVASLWLPWISPEDRKELAHRFADLVDPMPPEPVSEARHMPLRAWHSGLGRQSPIAILLPGPLPLSGMTRFRR